MVMDPGGPPDDLPVWRVDDFGAEVPDTEAEVVTTARRVDDTLARVGALGEEVARLDVASSTHAPAS